MVDSHQPIVDGTEEAFAHLKDLQIYHVHFQRHA